MWGKVRFEFSTFITDSFPIWCSSFHSSLLHYQRVFPDIYLLSDRDECLDYNGGCADLCVNTVGSYFCQCTNSGYSLANDMRSCVDVDECSLGTDLCNTSQSCINSVGGYACMGTGTVVVGENRCFSTAYIFLCTNWKCWFSTREVIISISNSLIFFANCTAFCIRLWQLFMTDFDTPMLSAMHPFLCSDWSLMVIVCFHFLILSW